MQTKHFLRYKELSTFNLVKYARHKVVINGDRVKGSENNVFTAVLKKSLQILYSYFPPWQTFRSN